ncbi:MAG: MFS transporter [Ardenticatenia bacterium]|nr:MFS transporter [Ardenticatenia bacterium]
MRPRVTTLLSESSAWRFVILLGLVSLFADATYEGARSIVGPYLALLGAGGTVVGAVAGLGELIGYALRLVSGYASDRTRRYWALTIGGYALNVLAVPLLALAGTWPLAAALIVAERVGKAVRTPARDAMLSYATGRVGRGWGFGFHEAMDQIGALFGPLLVAVALGVWGGYAPAFALLAVPALLTLAALGLAYRLYPNPQELEPTTPSLHAKGLGRAYWLYLAAVVLVAAGYADFPLIAYHVQRNELLPIAWVPLLYALTMGVDALAALLFGRWFDRRGLSVLMVAASLSATCVPLAFSGNAVVVVGGMVIWGVGMGAQESVLRAAIATMTPQGRRGSAYGLFNAGFGLAWFLGSLLMGVLYDRSLPALILFSVAAQLASVPLFFLVGRQVGAPGAPGATDT